MTTPRHSPEDLTFVVPARFAALDCACMTLTDADIACAGAVGQWWSWTFVSGDESCTEHKVAQARLRAPEGTLTVTAVWDRHAAMSEQPFAVQQIHEVAHPNGDVPPEAVVRSPDAVQHLMQACPDMDTDRVLSWALAGWPDARQIALAEEVGLTPSLAADWGEIMVNADPLFGVRTTVLSWATAMHNEPGLTVEDVIAWWVSGIRMPKDRPAGVSVEDTRRLHEIRTRPTPGWAGVAEVCSAVLRVAADPARGARPQEVVALGKALRGTGGMPCSNHDHWNCDWDEESVNRAVALIPTWQGLNWGKVALCLRAGMDPDEAARHVSTGADMQPVAFLASLAG